MGGTKREREREKKELKRVCNSRSSESKRRDIVNELYIDEIRE